MKANVLALRQFSGKDFVLGVLSVFLASTRSRFAQCPDSRQNRFRLNLFLFTGSDRTPHGRTPYRPQLSTSKHVGLPHYGQLVLY